MTNQGQPRSLLQATEQELLKMEEDILYTEKTHLAQADRFRQLHFVLGGAATLSGAAAAATITGQAAPWVSALLALLAALAAALVTFVKPQETEQKHLIAGRQLGALRVQIRQAVTLELLTTPAPSEFELKAIASRLAGEKAALDASAPSTSNRAFRRAQKKIQAGHFTHQVP